MGQRSFGGNVRLSENEKRMLAGEGGPVRQKALEFILRYAGILDAPALCRVTWADLFCGAHPYLEVVPSHEFDPVFSVMSLCAESSDPPLALKTMDPGCICYSGVEADCTERPDRMLMSPTQKEKNLAFLSRFVDAGVTLSGNCIPYLTGFVPMTGEHFVSCESSAVLFMNSVWGACGNGDGIEASFCAAICGRTPLWGNHLMDNRLPTIQVRILSRPETVHDWDLLGVAVGEALPAHARPYITGSFRRPNAIRLKAFFAALACAAGTEICHIDGVTPEAMFNPAVRERLPGLETLAITPQDTARTLGALNPGGRPEINYLSLGCPHYHIDELRTIAGFLEGRRIAPETRVELWTAGSIKYTADRCGYTRIIEAAGASLLTGSCPSSRGYPEGVGTAAYDSAKQRMSAAQETTARLFYGSLEDCLRTAVSGVWEGAA